MLIVTVLSYLSNIALTIILSPLLQGTIPATFSSLTSLKQLDLSYNFLTGELPSSGLPLSLEYLLATNNSLSGKIPQSLGSMSKLVELDTSHNAMTGVVPGTLCQLSGLTYINTAFNKHSCYDACLASKKSSSFGCPECSSGDDDDELSAGAIAVSTVDIGRVVYSSRFCSVFLRASRSPNSSFTYLLIPITSFFIAYIILPISYHLSYYISFITRTNNFLSRVSLLAVWLALV